MAGGTKSEEMAAESREGASASPPNNTKTAPGRRRIRHWITRMAVAAGLCSVCFAAILLGLRDCRTAETRQTILRDISGDMEHRLSGIESELQMLKESPSSFDRSRLFFWVSACKDELDELSRRFGPLLSGEIVYEEMMRAWARFESRVGEMGDGPSEHPVGETDIQEAAIAASVDLEVFEHEFGDLHSAVLAQIASRRRRATQWLNAAMVAAFAAFATCAWTGAVLMSAMTAMNADTDSLAKEVSQVSKSNPFQAKMAYLCRKKGIKENPTSGWTVDIDRVFSHKSSHTHFEAIAQNGDLELRLWGRRYRWGSELRSLPRYPFPMFAEAVGKALTLLKANDIPTPELIYHRHLRKGPFRAGSLVLVEHVGELKPLKEFVDAEFCLLSEPARRNVLRRLAQFIARVHRVGIYHLRPRSIHGLGYDNPNGEVELRLGDMDKLLIWERCPEPIRRWLIWRDRQRLLDRFGRNLNVDDLAALREMVAEEEQNARAQA